MIPMMIPAVTPEQLDSNPAIFDKGLVVAGITREQLKKADILACDILTLLMAAGIGGDTVGQLALAKLGGMCERQLTNAAIARLTEDPLAGILAVLDFAEEVGKSEQSAQA